MKKCSFLQLIENLSKKVLKKAIIQSSLVTVPNSYQSLANEGVVCLNPDDAFKRRLYQKTFEKKQVYLPGEYSRAFSDHIAGEDKFVFSMNGYSRITPDQARAYGIQEGAYEAACEAILKRVNLKLLTTFRGANLRLIHGASDMGVDKAIQTAGKVYGLKQLGFSCPKFMLYVNDDEQPVYVAQTAQDYANKYIQTLDLLIATGGRKHALGHDILAACVYNKRVHLVNVLDALSSTGGVPATITQRNGTVEVDNAVAALERNLSFFTRDGAMRAAPPGGDHWDAIFGNLESVATQVCREKMSPKKKFL